VWAVALSAAACTFGTAINPPVFSLRSKFSSMKLMTSCGSILRQETAR
jgi:hypothetical protein